MPLFSITYLIHQHCAKNGKKCHWQDLSTQRNRENRVPRDRKLLIFIGIEWLTDLTAAARGKSAKIFRESLPVILSLAGLSLLEVQSNDLHVFRAIKNFVGKKFFGENSDAAKSETENQRQQDDEANQHKNPDD